jgi:hypothetical protein
MPHHEIDAITLEGLRKRVHHVVESFAVAQQRGDVVEQDARLGEIGHVANLVLERIHRGVESL